jgi:hypothetical protein
MILRHLKKFLGASDTGWIENRLPFQVWRFRDKPCEGALTYATVGLSKHLLVQPDKPPIRQEFVFSCYDRFASLPIEKRLLAVGEDVINAHQAVIRGQILGPRGPLFEGVKVEALLSWLPFYFADEFQGFTTDDGSDVIFTWLIPLYREEAHHIGHHGWKTFESLVVELDPDFMDLGRPMMNLAAA